MGLTALMLNLEIERGSGALPSSIGSRFSGDGLCLFVKRLERGKFVWPLATSGTVHLTAAQLSMLLEGINWKRPERTWQPQVMV
jgi:transposase